jgi:hypothetical protein
LKHSWDRTLEHNNIDRIIANRLFGVELFSEEEIANRFKNFWEQMPEERKHVSVIHNQSGKGNHTSSIRVKLCYSDENFPWKMDLPKTFREKRNDFKFYQIFNSYSSDSVYAMQALQALIKRYNVEAEFSIKENLYFVKIKLFSWNDSIVFAEDVSSDFELSIGRGIVNTITRIEGSPWAFDKNHPEFISSRSKNNGAI